MRKIINVETGELKIGGVSQILVSKSIDKMQ